MHVRRSGTQIPKRLAAAAAPDKLAGLSAHAKEVYQPGPLPETTVVSSGKGFWMTAGTGLMLALSVGGAFTATSALTATPVPAEAHTTKTGTADTATAVAITAVGWPALSTVISATKLPTVPQPVTEDNLGHPATDLSSYKGPVLIASVNTLYDANDPAANWGNTGGPVFGAGPLLQKVAAAHVPIVYLADNPLGKSESAVLAHFPPGNVLYASPGHEADAINDFSRHTPGAQLFELGNDSKTDIATWAATGGHAYLLNTNPAYRLPADFHPVLTDTLVRGAFQDLVLSDLANAQHGLGPNQPDWEPAPPAPSGLAGALQSATPLLNALERLPGTVANLAVQLTHSATSAHRTVQATSSEDLARMSSQQLANLAGQLSNPGYSGLTADTLGPDIMRVVTAHGRDAGSVQQILSQVQTGFNPETWFKGESLAQFQALNKAQEAHPGQWDAFDTYMDQATNSQLRPGTKVEVLSPGTVAFPRMFEAIDQAHLDPHPSVNHSVYDFQSDEAGWDMARHLAAAADKGVPTRLMYDPDGSATTNGAPTNPAIFQYLKSHGVTVEANHTGHGTHRKILVVNGKIGFIGGMNDGNQYRDTWLDVHSQVTGPGVGDLQRLFTEQWMRNGYHISDADQQVFFPTLQPVEGAGSARIVGHIGGNHDQSMKLAYLRATRTASHDIKIMDPYFTDAELATALSEAAERGVQVQLFFPKVNDNAQVQAVQKSYYPQWLKAGVQILEYDGNPMQHAKVASFDDEVYTIGSSNLDWVSLTYNDEANVWGRNRTVAMQLDSDVFERARAQTTRVTSYAPTQQEAATAAALAKTINLTSIYHGPVVSLGLLANVVGLVSQLPSPSSLLHR